LLKELSQEELKPKKGRTMIMFYTDGEFTDDNVLDMVKQIVPGFDPDHTPKQIAFLYYPPGGPEITAVSISSTRRESKDIAKSVRRLSRGKIRFKWDWDYIQVDVFQEFRKYERQ